MALCSQTSRGKLGLGVDAAIEMATDQAPESFHSVTLSVHGSGHPYTANIWRGSANQWRLLSVDVHRSATVEVHMPPFGSCRSALEQAERVAIEVLANGSAPKDSAA